ncbi:MAG: helix-hairpin-helix domain-containing protein [Rhodocyclaceae bacterium]
MRRLLILVFALLAAIQLAFAAVDINTASEAELDGLPGIGPTKARAIVADRQQHGPFKSVGDLKRVKGIGDKMLEKLRGQVTVGGVADTGPKIEARPAKPNPGTALPKPAGANPTAPAGAKPAPPQAKRTEGVSVPTPAGAKPAAAPPAPAGLRPAGASGGAASPRTAKPEPEKPAAPAEKSGERPAAAGGKVPAPAGAKGNPGKSADKAPAER